MSFKFEKILVWQKAMDLGEEMNSLSLKLPAEEKFNLSSQIRRASDSIALNIAEGSIVQSTLEFKKFLGYSIRSLAEIVTCLHKLKRRQYIDDSTFKKYYLESITAIGFTLSCPAFDKKGGGGGGRGVRECKDTK